MDTQGALLWQTLFFIPIDHAVWARFYKVLLPFCLFWVNHHDPVVPLIDGVLLGRLDARGVIAVHAWSGEIDHIHFGILPPLFPHDVYPPMAMPGLGRRIGREIVFPVLVLAGKKAVITIVTFGHVDD